MNQPLVSVVVSTHFSAGYLERCLVSIRDQTYSNIELIVVDGRSNDATRDIALKYADRLFVDQGDERSVKRNFGVKKSKGDYVCIADSDMLFSPDVIESCVRKVLSDETIIAVVIPEQSVGKSFWAQCKALERSFYVGIDWMEAARFYKKEAYLRAGGYDEKNTGSEDYDLSQRVKADYGKNAVQNIDEFICQEELNLGLIQSCKKKFYYSASFINYRANEANAENFLKQSNILLRYKLFFLQPRKLFKRPIVGFCMIFMKTCEFVVGGIGFFFSRIRN